MCTFAEYLESKNIQNSMTFLLYKLWISKILDPEVPVSNLCLLIGNNLAFKVRFPIGPACLYPHQVVRVLCFRGTYSNTAITLNKLLLFLK